MICNAITTQEIKGSCIPTIPIGTKFRVTCVVSDYSYANCEGLPIHSIWSWEYELIPEVSI